MTGRRKKQRMKHGSIVVQIGIGGTLLMLAEASTLPAVTVAMDATQAAELGLQLVVASERASGSHRQHAAALESRWGPSEASEQQTEG